MKFNGRGETSATILGTLNFNSTFAPFPPHPIDLAFDTSTPRQVGYVTNA